MERAHGVCVLRPGLHLEDGAPGLDFDDAESDETRDRSRRDIAADHPADALEQRAHGYFASTAARISSAWPSGLTLGQTAAILPFSSIRYVTRFVPMYLRPYMLFSPQVP